MIKGARIALAAVLMLSAGSVAAQDQDHDQGNAKAGRAIAVKHCSRCHVIPDLNPYGGLGSTASFKTMARMQNYRDRFLNFFVRPPHPVFVEMAGVELPTNLPSPVATFVLQPEDVGHILAYAETLRGP